MTSETYISTTKIRDIWGKKFLVNEKFSRGVLIEKFTNQVLNYTITNLQLNSNSLLRM